MDKLGINLLKHHDNIALIVQKEGKQNIIYRDLLKQVLKTSLFIESESDIPKCSTIGILGDKSYALVALTLGIIETDNTFCYLTKDDLDDLSIEYFFSLSPISLSTIELRKTLVLCDLNIYFYKTKSVKEVKQFNYADNEMNKVCYRITTSGTTGRRKIIHVTYNSIYPNIKGLQEIFKLDHSDVVLSASPITFDVFIVDLFLALHSGSSLLILADNHRFDTSIYSKTSDKSVTFLQMTPTIFRQYGLDNIKNKILHSESSLKYLVLGGEEFPSPKEVLTWQDFDNESSRKRIFNIYGVTEMSCWSLIHEITKKDLEFGKICLGSPIDSDTLPAYYPYPSGLEELILTTSSRVNYFDDKEWDKKLGTNGIFAYVTNDLIEKIDGKIYWHGRSNDMVKRFGERVDLKKIEEIASEIVHPVSCIMIRKRIALFYQSEQDDVCQLLSNHLRLKLRKVEFPDDIKRIDFLPTCDHGKVSKKKLKELYKDILKEDNIKQNAEDVFLDAINKMFNLSIEKPSESNGDEPDGKRMKYNIDSSFQQIGGSSFDALRIVMKIEDRMSSMSNALLPKLLDNQNSIKDILTYLKGLNLKSKNGDAINLVNFIDNSKHSLDLKFQKKFDLQKCIDSSPALINIKGRSYIVVGGHSGNLITIDADDLSVMSIINLGDRIECEAVQFCDYVLVGCYDGFIYCVDVLSADKNDRIKFKYNSGAMIKSKPLIINDFVIFGNYNYEENLRCLKVNENADNVELKWSKVLGMSGIIANILQIDNESILVCTLDGIIERLRINDASKIWNKKYEYPIFSSPQKISHMKAIIFAEVMRKVHCIDYDGNALWKFETDGHIFSSFLFNPINDNNVQIMFGCHDNKIRCIDYDNQGSKVSKKWMTDLQSQIYGTPKIINFNTKNYIVSCSTNGYVNLLNILSGKMESSSKLPGDIFSSPLIHNDKLFIGCRDNYVYCLSLKPN
ncbi:hypothetical protein ACKWTF_001675 [Chironomus riparius]